MAIPQFTPPPPSETSRRSLEREPIPERTPEQPKSPETRLEELEARRMAEKTGALRGRAGISLESLKERVKTRSYDKKTPELINRINLYSESPEAQNERLLALRDVSVMLLATLLYHDKNLDVSSLENVSFLTAAVNSINPRPAENAAFHKLRELALHGDSAITQYVKNEWQVWVNAGREISEQVKPAMEAAEMKKDEPLKREEEWTIKGFRKKHPVAFWSCAIAGGIGAFLAVRGIVRWITGSGQQAETAPSQAEAAQGQPSTARRILSAITLKPSGFFGWLKWLCLGGAAAFVLGKIVGVEKIVDLIKKAGDSVKDVTDKIFGEENEYAKNKAVYDRMAQRIGVEMSTSVNASFLGNDVGKEKFKDMMDDESLWSKYVLDTAVGDTASKINIPGLGALCWSQEQRKQARAVRTYLKRNPEILARISVNDDTTVAQVLAKVDEELNKKEGVTETPGQKPAEAADELHASILPFFKANYDTEIAADDYNNLSGIAYRDFIKRKEMRGLAQAGKAGIAGLGAELGVIGTTTAVEAERLKKAEKALQRFFADNAELARSLNLPETATVGETVAAIIKSGRVFRREAAATAAGVAAGAAAEESKEHPLTNDEIAGIEKTRESARQLPAEKWRLYEGQEKLLREMVDDKEYIPDEDVQAVINASNAVADNLDREAAGIADKLEMGKKQKLAGELRSKALNLQRAMNNRNARLREYQAVIEKNGSEEEMHEAFLRLHGTNEELLKIHTSSEEKLSEEHRWKAMATLAGLQVPRIIYMFATRPAHYKEFVRHYWGVFGLPNAMIARITRHLTQPSGGIRLTRQRIEEARSRLTGDLGGAGADGSGSLESRANLSAKGGSDRNDAQKQAFERYETEKALLEHDEGTLKLRTEIDDLESGIADMKAKKVPADNPELKRLEQQLAEKTNSFKARRRQRVKLEASAIQEASDDLYGRVKKTPEVALEQRQWREVEDLAKRGAGHNRELMEAGEDILDDIVAAQRRGAPAAEIAALKKSFEETVGAISANQKSLIKRFSAFFEGFRGARRIGGELKPEQQKQFRRVLGYIFHWQKKGGAKEAAEKTLFKTFKGKFYFYGLTFAAGTALGIATKDEKTSMLRAGGQAALDLAPVTGTLSDFYTMAEGREAISGRKVTGYERWLMRPVFGVVGLASDILLVAGVGVGMRAGISALKAGAEASRIARLKGAIGAAAEAAGKSAAKKAAKAASEGAVEGAGKGGAGRLRSVLQRITHGGAVATIGLGVGGLALSLVQQDEMEIPPAIAELGGPGSQLTDADIENLPSPEE